MITLFILSFSVFAESPCQCPYSTSPGSGYQWVDPGDYSWDHSFGEGGTCTATCTVLNSGSCKWTNQSSGCYGTIDSSDYKLQVCRFEIIQGDDGAIDCVVCGDKGITCDWGKYRELIEEQKR